MASKWFSLKPAVLALRRNGKSLTFIETHLGIPRSTLSVWCREVALTEQQSKKLRLNSAKALVKGRVLAAARHRQKSEARLKQAEEQAALTLASLSLTPSLAKLALAVLYWGEGKKSQATALGSVDSQMLLFFLAAIKISYGVERHNVVCELHLRKDQNSQKEVEYWSGALRIPQASFKRIYFDRRTRETTYDNYHGVCLLYCPGIAIQRELVYLYKSFSKEIIKSMGD